MYCNEFLSHFLLIYEAFHHKISFGETSLWKIPLKLQAFFGSFQISLEHLTPLEVAHLAAVVDLQTSAKCQR